MISALEEREVARVPVERVAGETLAQSSDDLSVEEPLEIRVETFQGGRRCRVSLAVTMRTPATTPNWQWDSCSRKGSSQNSATWRTWRSKAQIPYRRA